MYKLQNGDEIKVGKQNIQNETVEVEYEGTTIICKMFQDEQNDLGFYCADECVYFRDL